MWQKLFYLVALIIGLMVVFFIVILFLEEKPDNLKKDGVSGGKLSSVEEVKRIQEKNSQLPKSNKQSAILSAREGWDFRSEVMTRAEKYSIDRHTNCTKFVQEMLSRLEANSKLEKAFLLAKEANVSIFLTKYFQVSAGYVEVNVDATDQEIIDFLLGL